MDLFQSYRVQSFLPDLILSSTCSKGQDTFVLNNTLLGSYENWNPILVVGQAVCFLCSLACEVVCSCLEDNKIKKIIFIFCQKCAAMGGQEPIKSTRKCG